MITSADIDRARADLTVAFEEGQRVYAWLKADEEGGATLTRNRTAAITELLAALEAIESARNALLRWSEQLGQTS